MALRDDASRAVCHFTRVKRVTHIKLYSVGAPWCADFNILALQVWRTKVTPYGWVFCAGYEFLLTKTGPCPTNISSKFLVSINLVLW